MFKRAVRSSGLSLVFAFHAALLPAGRAAEPAVGQFGLPVRVVDSLDADPDEGLPGGTVRLPGSSNADDAPPIAPTGQEKSAANAEAPTADRSGDADAIPTRTLTAEMSALRDKIRKALAIYSPKHLNTRDNSPWEMMHAIIAYGVDTTLLRGNSKGEEINAIAWMCYNGSCRGEHLFYLNGGKMVVRKGPGLQGHAGQFLAIIAQSHVRSDYPLNISGKPFTLQDLIEHEKSDCQAGEELTFKLIGLMHYLNSEATWQNRDGQPWSISRLVREEMAQPIRGAACGGTHRLMGLSYAVNKRKQRGETINGEFQRAQGFIGGYHRYTFSLQNPDGSFSTEWFTRPGSNPDQDRRLKTTGHIAEWLSFSLSEDELMQPQMVKAIDYLAGILVNGKDRSWEIGPLGHGLHALRIYDRRIFKPLDAKPVAFTSRRLADHSGAAEANEPDEDADDSAAAAASDPVRF